jgi:hypothetical protein
MLLAVAAVFLAIWLVGITALQRPPALIHAALVIAVGSVVAHFYLQRRACPGTNQEPDSQREQSSLLKGK